MRLLIIWIVASAICCPLVYIVAGPHMPPGDMSSSASNQQFDFNVLATIATPVVLGVLIYIGYAMTFWRAKDGDDTDGPPIHGNTKIQLTWIAATSAIVLALAAFGTVELWTVAGRGRRRGPAAHLEAELLQHPPDPGHRPAVDLDLPLPAVRRLRDHPA